MDVKTQVLDSILSHIFKSEIPLIQYIMSKAIYGSNSKQYPFLIHLIPHMKLMCKLPVNAVQPGQYVAIRQTYEGLQVALRLIKNSSASLIMLFVHLQSLVLLSRRHHLTCIQPSWSRVLEHVSIS